MIDTKYTDRTMIGRILTRGNFLVWFTGQLIAFGVGTSLAIQHDWSVGLAVCFALIVLVDIRGQL